VLTRLALLWFGRLTNRRIYILAHSQKALPHFRNIWNIRIHGYCESKSWSTLSGQKCLHTAAWELRTLSRGSIPRHSCILERIDTKATINWIQSRRQPTDISLTGAKYFAGSTLFFFMSLIRSLARISARRSVEFSQHEVIFQKLSASLRITSAANERKPAEIFLK